MISTPDMMFDSNGRLVGDVCAGLALISRSLDQLTTAEKAVVREALRRRP